MIELPRTLPYGESVVAIQEFQGRLLVACSHGLYEVVGPNLIPIPLKLIPSEGESK